MTSLSDYHFTLPSELIAQHPQQVRDQSRLMVIDRETENISHRKFYDIKEYLNEDDALILNDTKVIPARLIGKRETGGKIELLLLKPLGSDTWEVLAKPGRKLRLGQMVYFSNEVSAEILANQDERHFVVRFYFSGGFQDILNEIGQMPLPPYIHRDKPDKQDIHRYQTIYARHTGAIAAPTAGLHFTEKLLGSLEEKRVQSIYIALHVGLGTFNSVKKEDIRNHHMHTEEFIINDEAAKRLNVLPVKNNHLCIGTTTLRALESAVNIDGDIVAGKQETNIFIYPGYRFKYVQRLLTNFHLPKSTLLILISAFAGYELIMRAYREAVEKQYRFFSYGDAMLIL